MKLVRTLILSTAILFIFVWTQSPLLSSYNLQLTGALILLYFGSKYLFRVGNSNTLILETVVLVSVVLLLIFSSGGINSPIFFVLFFLLFVIALLFDPYQAAVASFFLVSFFLWENFSNLSSIMVVDLVSLILMTPLAIIFGDGYLKSLQSEGKISLLKEAIKDEETDSLLWISTTAKPSLATILNSLTDVVIYLNSKGQNIVISTSFVEKLKTIQKDLISLYASTGTLEKSIKDSSDKTEL
ncbi:MAG: hypothetical protein WA052_00035 [Microgenomates group bacterium]